MNALYSPLNIYIALVGVVVWTEYDEITLSTDGDTTLKNFLNYRKERLVKEHPNDNAQLLTGIQFEGGVVGKSNLVKRKNWEVRLCPACNISTLSKLFAKESLMHWILLELYFIWKPSFDNIWENKLFLTNLNPKNWQFHNFKKYINCLKISKIQCKISW